MQKCFLIAQKQQKSYNKLMIKEKSMTKNKKLLAALLCLSSLIASSTSFASQEAKSIKEPAPKAEEIESKAQKENPPKLDKIDQEEPQASKEEIEVLNTDNNQAIGKSEEKSEKLQENSESREGQPTPPSYSDRATTTNQPTTQKRKPIVYYDRIPLDDILKNHKSYIQETIKATGDYQLIKKEKGEYLYDPNGQIIKSQTTIIKNKIYKTDNQGLSKQVINNWAYAKNEYYHTDKQGKLYQGFKKINNQDYYFQNTGILLRNAFINQNRTIYKANNQGVLEKARNQWAQIGEKTYYTDQNAQSLAGKQKISGKNYYFYLKEGLAKNKEIVADGGRYKANTKGELSFIRKEKKGWVSLDGLHYFFKEDNNLARGLYDSGSNRYVFHQETGEMTRNQIHKQGFDRIHVADNGVAHYIGWDYFNGKLGYFKENGSYATGLVKINGMTYGFDKEGKIYDRQYKKIGNQWWYFNKYGEARKSNGKFARGWVGNRYYFADGKPAEGIQVIGGKTYIFHERTREKLRNTVKVFNFNKYKTDWNGVARKIGRIDTRPAIMGTRGQFRPGFTQYLNRKTPYFRQVDPRWSYRRFSSGTLGGYGCGPTAMAMVLNKELHRNDIYPTNTAVDASDYADDGTDWQYFRENPRIYGLRSYDVPVNEKALIQALKEGSVVVRVGAGYFTTGGHYIVIDSYKDGYFTINDPYSVSNTMEKQPFWRLKQEVTVAWQIKK